MKMGLYEIKMHLKRLKIVKYVLERKFNKESSEKQERLAENGLQCIIEVESCLKEYRVNYFSDFGTLLGIIRDHQFISWDIDIDYGILLSDEFDWFKFEKHLNSYGFEKIRQFRLYDKIREQTYRKGDITIDFFGHENIEGRGIIYDFYRQEGYIYHSIYEHHVRKANYDMVEKTRTELFLGVEVRVPENAESYLESVYSASWKIPNPEWSDSNFVNMEILSDLGYGDFLVNSGRYSAR